MASDRIFLYIHGGRTLWVPGHTPAPTETRPVHLLSFVTPMELSRSFYLFEFPLQVVDDPRLTTLNPHARTAHDVIVAVNEFRRVCAEDQSFLLQRCYNPNRPPAAVEAPPAAAAAPSNVANVLGATSPAGSGTNTGDLLAQLLQQRQQQAPMMSSTLFNSNPMANMFGSAAPSVGGGDAGSALGPSGGTPAAGNAGGGNPYMPSATGSLAPPAPYLSPNNAMFSFMGNMTAGGGRGGRHGGRYGRYDTNPNMFMGPGVNPAMMAGGFGAPGGGMYGGRGGRVGAAGPDRQFASEVRRVPEPIDVKVAIPPEIAATYMNPAQVLVCATMPGPRMTVWLREREPPTDKKDSKYVFCKGGIILMLKAAWSDVEKSKPVELFAKQICTHFLIHGYCSRSNCLHEHHTEEQLRQLIAARHVELKAMSKKQRHQLIEGIREREIAGLAKAEEEREARQREREEASAARKAAYEQRTTHHGNTATAGSPAVHGAEADEKRSAGSEATPRAPVARIDLGSDEEDNEAEAKKHVAGPANGDGGSAPVDPIMASKATRKVHAVSLADIGVTDSDSDDDSSSNSSSSSSSTSSSSSSSDAPSAKQKTADVGHVTEEVVSAAEKAQQEQTAQPELATSSAEPTEAVNNTNEAEQQPEASGEPPAAPAEAEAGVAGPAHDGDGHTSEEAAPAPTASGEGEAEAPAEPPAETKRAPAKRGRKAEPKKTAKRTKK